MNQNKQSQSFIGIRKTYLIINMGFQARMFYLIFMLKKVCRVIHGLYICNDKIMD